MTSPFHVKADLKTNQTEELQDVAPEVKSYIYQTIAEFEPFTTPETVITVTAKDPMKLVSQYESEDTDFDQNKLKTMHRIVITLAEDGGKLEEEGLHEDITAIRVAKEKLLKTLNEIQDQVISSSERKMQIDMAVGGGHIH